MIARAAECNPSCFSPTPLVDVARTLIPDYLRLVSCPSIFLTYKPDSLPLSPNTSPITGPSQSSASHNSKASTSKLPKRARTSSVKLSSRPKALTISPTLSVRGRARRYSGTSHRLLRRVRWLGIGRQRSLMRRRLQQRKTATQSHPRTPKIPNRRR